LYESDGVRFIAMQYIEGRNVRQLVNGRPLDLVSVYDINPATASDPLARDAASHALALDETLAEAHASLASVSYRFDWQWTQSEQHFKRAIEPLFHNLRAESRFTALVQRIGLS
jgi:serine/threonine-protein kinase